MYSIALLMALTSGGEVSDSHRHGGCCGCQGYVESCGCYGGGHHRHHRHHGGCCGCQGYVQNCGCCGVQQSCGCCGVQQACGCCGMTMVGGGGMVPPPAPGGEQLKNMPAPKKTTAIAAPATIVVELPADATLKVDGAATASTSSVRVLVSPELNYGKEYQYTLSAQVVRDGKSVQVEKSVLVHAGEESHVRLDLPVASVAMR
jgi:uncharacterized protein (TIGR03000 family)